MVWEELLQQQPADVRTLQLRQAQTLDLVLIVAVALFLSGSYLCCRFCRACSRSRQDKKNTQRQFDKKQHMARVPGAALLVSDMEQPLLGPPDYEQPPAYERSPPAYEYLPSAPPLGCDSPMSVTFE